MGWSPTHESLQNSEYSHYFRIKSETERSEFLNGELVTRGISFVISD